ncbi:hypothetical protein FGSG_07929 [Fusarium graminearum PH-1]|uniref:Chromosome 4, complete genome n=1 Tax=Gibberella zeae (strain ATCC MYA-4620 / CBS 123657 / FGSC 9075 / NRRL 31084 / PH-1) TaxID=229533 RepID=I1RUN0_GIBZE|nr:hypothetical protein FGSG_07929 [Fusarium graminearum PH-1]ESU14263.1 hypothetical protein FGSG_07929 [Fusarium graminearum PH-1]EYB30398.1 hypothetical protein FG05_07929 [Fusarium graminearum]CEF85051.1 unnamed protein product [Fusarium graminearum]|eukprot:XP_011327770.1 hypothetical protein FGSG_07929 [Fusarium graminearum PH-1]
MEGLRDAFAHISARAVKDWPAGSKGNTSETIISNVPFNLTTLKYFNYTYYSNETVSNGSKCYLTFDPYTPAYVFPNGSWTNATKCYTAIEHIKTRGFVGIGFAVAFGIALVLNLTVLAKHGKIYTPRDSRFYPVGRRWQWYWALFTSAAALISLFVGVDIDRYYLQELPITVNVFFWYLLCTGTVALTWEAVRHWGSWQERKFVDPDPFIVKDNDRRAKVEFWLPLWFYLWLWLNFFMVVPRSWKFTQLQHSEEQTLAKAVPGATNTRFKAGALCLVVAWLTIVFSLYHSIKHYKPRHRGVFNRAVGFIRYVPFRFWLILPLSAATIAYQGFISWEFKYSIVKYNGNIPVIYCWGFLPSLLILFTQYFYGFFTPNEDKELVRLRRERGEMLDRELGLVNKPAWWKRVRGDHLLTFKDKLTRNVHEIGGGHATGRRIEGDAERDLREEALAAARNDEGFEMSHMHRPLDAANNPRVGRAGAASISSNASRLSYVQPYTGKNDRRRHERNMQAAAGILFPNNLAEERARREAQLGLDGPAPPPYTDGQGRGRAPGRPGSTGRSNSTETTNSITAPPQQIKSMLDV